MSRGLLNNNPGNLKVFKSHFFIGEKRQTTDPPFRQFYEIDFGYRAMFKQLEMYGECGINSIKTIITRWSGETKEIIEAYVNFICQKLDKQPNEILNMMDKNTLIQLVSAISQYYNVSEAIYEEVMAGYELFMTTKIK